MEGHAQSLEGIGVSKATCLEEDFKYEAKLKFPWRGGGVQHKNQLTWGSVWPFSGTTM